MAILCLQPFKHFHALLLGDDQPFEGFDVSLQVLNRLDGFFESFTQVVIRFAGLLQLFVFALQLFVLALQFFIFTLQHSAQSPILGSELLEFFILRHTATLADLTLILQLHSPSE